jgi:DNA-binding transcriptional LysR family regulator
VVLAELEHAQASLDASLGQVVGTVRVAAFQSAVLTVVPGVLLALQERHPDLRVEVTEMEPELSLPALLAGDFDLVVAEEYPNQPLARIPGTDRQTLLLDPLALVTARSWGPVRLSDLAERPFAMEPDGTTSRRWAEAYCRSHGVEPDVRYTSTDLQIHLRLVRHGLAAAILPGLAAAQGQAGVTTAALPGRPRRRVFHSTRTGSRQRPALHAVIAALREATP